MPSLSLWFFIGQVYPYSVPKLLCLEWIGGQDTHPLPPYSLVPGHGLLWDNDKLRWIRPEAPTGCTVPQCPGVGILHLEHSLKGPLRSVAQWPQCTAEQTKTSQVKSLPKVTPQSKGQSQFWNPLQYAAYHPKLLLGRPGWPGLPFTPSTSTPVSNNQPRKNGSFGDTQKVPRKEKGFFLL